jgi:hypothetical protein
LFTNRLLAASLGLTLLAGCSTPTPVSPSAPAAPAAAPQDAAAAAPQAPVAPQAQPAAATPAAIATLNGKATFRGEALSGYAITVLDARTGQPVALTNDLASAKGLAVLNDSLTTAADGTFKLQVAGLTTGQALRVQVRKGNGLLETIVNANQQVMGAKQRRVFDGSTAPAIEISELTTAIAMVARGVLETSSLLTPEAAAPILADLATQMADLSDRLSKKLAETGLASGIVSDDPHDADANVHMLLDNAGELRNLANTVAGLVADVAKAAQTESNQSSALVSGDLAKQLSHIDLAGTVLSAEFDAHQNAFVLKNSITGGSVNPSSGNLGSVTSVVKSSGGGSSAPAPAVSTSKTVEVTDRATFLAALADSTVTTIKLTQNVSMAVAATYRVSQVMPDFTAIDPCVPVATIPSCPGYVAPVIVIPPTPTMLTVGRTVTIDGNSHQLTGLSGFEVSGNGVTLKNLQLPSLHDLAVTGTTATLDGLVMTLTPGMQLYTAIDASNAVTIKNCTFSGYYNDIALNYNHTDDQLTTMITDNHFNAPFMNMGTFTLSGNVLGGWQVNTGNTAVVDAFHTHNNFGTFWTDTNLWGLYNND